MSTSELNILGKIVVGITAYYSSNYLIDYMLDDFTFDLQVKKEFIVITSSIACAIYAFNEA